MGLKIYFYSKCLNFSCDDINASTYEHNAEKSMQENVIKSGPNLRPLSIIKYDISLSTARIQQYTNSNRLVSQRMLDEVDRYKKEYAKTENFINSSDENLKHYVTCLRASLSKYQKSHDQAINLGKRDLAAKTANAKLQLLVKELENYGNQTYV